LKRTTFISADSLADLEISHNAKTDKAYSIDLQTLLGTVDRLLDYQVRSRSDLMEPTFQVFFIGSIEILAKVDGMPLGALMKPTTVTAVSKLRKNMLWLNIPADIPAISKLSNCYR
jgi:hypothetical protein